MGLSLGWEGLLPPIAGGRNRGQLYLLVFLLLPLQVAQSTLDDAGGASD